MAFLWGAVVMRAMAVVACGFALVACSASTPSLSFLSPSRLRPKHCGSNRNHRGPKSKPPWGKTCHTPCNITSQLIPDLTATFALSGYESQTVVVQVAASTAATSAQFASNPVYVELRPVPVAAPLKNRVSRQLRRITPGRIRPGSNNDLHPDGSGRAQAEPSQGTSVASARIGVQN
jgi:hypothetical protein